MTVKRDLTRLCACGCERGIGYLQAHAKYHPVCKVAIDRDRQLAQRRARLKLRPRTRTPYANFVKADRPVAERNPQRLCKICFGMAWARMPTRFGESGPSIHGVADATGVLCRGCGLAYSPEPPPERMSVLGSSAGTAVREGQLHGVQHVASGKPKAKSG